MNVTLNVTFDEAFRGAQKRVTVRVPAIGVRDAQREDPRGRRRPCFRGKGGAGQAGGQAGDLLITTRIKRACYYAREGADVVMDVPVSSIAEAALGASVVVHLPSTPRCAVKIPRTGTAPS